MLTTIIFDFFGVFHQDPFRTWLKETGFDKATREKFNKKMEEVDLGQMDSDEYLHFLATETGQDVDAIFTRFRNPPALNPEITDLVSQLGSKYKLGLLSNAGEAEILPLLDKYGYGQLFSVVHVSAQTGLIKPGRESFENILASLGSQPNETVFIDDSSANVEAAEQLGIVGIQYQNLDQLRKELEAMHLL